MRDILSEVLPTGYDKVTNLERVGNTNFLYGGLNIIYGLEGSGKSWQVAASDFEDKDVVYIDTDGSNGTLFVEHCNRHNVHYVSSDTVMLVGKEYVNNKNKNKDHTQIPTVSKVRLIIENIITHNEKKYNDFKPVFIIDSLSSVSEGAEINNSEKISPALYQMNSHAEEYGYCMILIDHATIKMNAKGIPSDFKLEGNEGGKKRTTVTTNKYSPIDPNKPELGGVFLCERARGNICGLKKGDKCNVSSATCRIALDWFSDRFPEVFDRDIKQSEFTAKTKNEKDKWIRDFKKDLLPKGQLVKEDLKQKCCR